VRFQTKSNVCLQLFAGIFFDSFDGLIFPGRFISWAVVNDVVRSLLGWFTTWAFRIQPHLCISEPKRPIPQSKRFSVTHSFLCKVNTIGLEIIVVGRECSSEVHFKFAFRIRLYSLFTINNWFSNTQQNMKIHLNRFMKIHEKYENSMN